MAERNYYVRWWELLAIVSPLEHFHKYLYGQEFHLRTDHSALTWLTSFKNLSALSSAYGNTTSLPSNVKVKNNNADAH
jgi:hypothetical protein